MKFLIVGVLLSVVIGLSWQLGCRNQQDCNDHGMVCAQTGSVQLVLSCQIFNGVGTCTCQSPHPTGECVNRTECLTSHTSCPTVLGLTMDWHCVDRHCKCLFTNFLDHIFTLPKNPRLQGWCITKSKVCVGYGSETFF